MKFNLYDDVTSANDDDLLLIDQAPYSGDTVKNISVSDLMANSGHQAFVTVGSADADYITDGVADDVQIQAAIDAVNTAGGGIIFIKHGTYAIDNTIIMKSNVKLQGEGNTTILQNNQASYAVFRHTDNAGGLSYITLQDINVKAKVGGGGAWYSRGGLNFANFINCSFTAASTGIAGFIVFFDAYSTNQNILVDNCYLSGLTAGSDMLGSGMIYSTVKNCTFEDGDGQGTANTGASYCKYLNNKFYKVGNPVSLEGANSHNIIDGNYAYYSGYFKSSLPGGSSDTSVANIITNNRSDYCTNGIEVGQGTACIVSSNIVYRSQNDGIFLSTTGSNIEGNICYQCNWGNSYRSFNSVTSNKGGIQLVNSTYQSSPANNSISDNIIFGDHTSWTHPVLGTSKADSTGGVAIDTNYTNTYLNNNTIKLFYGVGTKETVDAGTSTIVNLVHLTDSAGANSSRIEDSNSERIFELFSDGTSYMDFRIHNSPYNEINNGYFQDWDSSSSPWAWGTSGGAVLAQETASANKRLGNYSCKVTTATVGDALIQYTPRADNEGINVTTSLSYKKSSGSTNLWLAAYNTSSGAIYTEMELDSVHDSKTLDFALGWYRPRLTYAPTGSGDTIGIKIYQKAAGTAVYYIDEVQTHEGDGEYAWTDTAIVVGHDQNFASSKTYRKDFKQKFRDDNQYIYSDTTNSLTAVAPTAIKLTSGLLQVNAGLQVLSTAKTADFTAGASTHYQVDDTSGNVTVSFPSASGLDGTIYMFTKTAGGNSVILDALGGQLVGLDTTLTLNNIGDYAVIIAVSAQWRLISTNSSRTQIHSESKTADFTAGPAGSYLCDATSGTITVSFTTASGQAGTRYTFTKTDASSNAVTLDALGGQLFERNGSTSLTISLTKRYESITVEAQGGQWVILQASASTLVTPYVAVTGTYSILTTDSVIDCTSGTFTATLPTAVGVKGQQYTIKNSGTGVITVATTSAQTIDGGSTASLAVRYVSITVVSDNANWKVI